MKLVVVAVLLSVVFVSAAKHSAKNRRIIRIRVPQRQYLDVYGGHKAHLRPVGYPGRYRDYHMKHYEFIRPNHPPPFNSFGNVYLKQQSRPPPSVLLFPGPTSGPSFKEFSKEVIPQKALLSHGSGFPHKGSSVKFPSFKDEVRITVSSHPPPSPPSPPPVPYSSPSASSFPSLHQATSYHNLNTHSQSSDDGPIKEIPAPNLSVKPHVLEAAEYETYGKGPSIDVTHLVNDNGGQLSFPASEYYSAFGQGAANYVSDNQLTGQTGYYKEEELTSANGGESYEGSVKIEEGASAYIPEGSYKSNEIAVTPVPAPSSGYEVTENEKFASGAGKVDPQYFYAPDPDPSMPVHKVPPTSDSFVEEKKLSETYVSGVGQNFQILEGGSVAAPVTTLSAQELYHLMNGYSGQIIPQAIVAEPVVTILGHPQAGVILQPNYAYSQNDGGHYGDRSNGQFQSNSIGQSDASQQIVLQQQQQQQTGYIALQPVYQHQYRSQADSSSHSQSYQSGDSSEQQQQQYEPEASESEKLGLFAETDDVSSKRENSVETTDLSIRPEDQVIIRFNKLPEVPFYTTLPNKQAAEALATLQAAGSIGSSYVSGGAHVNTDLPNTLRGDQAGEYDGSPADTASLGLPKNVLSTPQQVSPQTEAPQRVSPQTEETPRSTTTTVDIQQSISIYEASYPDTSLAEESGSVNVQTASKDEAFGKRIRLK